jgi:hypothetical protein
MTIPDTAPAPAPGTPLRGGRSVRRIVLIAGLVIVLAAVGTAVGAETYARKHYSQCIAAQLQKSLGSKVSVHFGARPLLLTALDHKVDSITVDSDNAQFGPADGMTVHDTLTNINLQKTNVTIGSSTADTVWSDDGITQSLNGLVSGVHSNPTAGTLEVKALGGLAGLQLYPHIMGNRIQVDTSDAQLLGIGLPTDLVDGIVKTMSESLQSYPLTMQPTSLKVTDTGIDVTLSGGATTLQADPNANVDIRC